MPLLLEVVFQEQLLEADLAYLLYLLNLAAALPPHCAQERRQLLKSAKADIGTQLSRAPIIFTPTNCQLQLSLLASVGLYNLFA